MKRYHLFLAAAALLGALPAQVPTHYWVDAVKGADTNPGTQAKPFKSITRSAKTALVNAVIHILPGVYSKKTTGETFPIGLGTSAGASHQNVKFLGTDPAVCIVDLGGGTSSPSPCAFKLGQFGTKIEIAFLTIRNGNQKPGWWEYGIQIGAWKSDYCPKVNIHNCVFSKVVRGISLWGDKSNDVYIHDNVFLDCLNDCVNIFDKGKVYVFNNLIYNGNYLGILASGGPESADNSWICNNIVIGCKEGIVSDTTSTKAVLQGNCCFQNKINDFRTKLSLSKANLSVDPQVVNIAGGDYHLKSASPCIEKGYHMGIPGMRNDFYGNARVVDIDNDGLAVPDIGVQEVNVIDLQLVKNWGLGMKPEFKISGSPSLALSVLFYLGFRPGSFVADPFGVIGVDPSSFLVTSFTIAPSPPNWTPFAIPNSPFLKGVPVHIQALAFKATAQGFHFKPTGTLDLFL